jgi:hypothetical protein
MTQQHPITPPPQLVGDWIAEADELDLLTPSNFIHVANRAAQWGADQELEACCEWVTERTDSYGSKLRAARRPKNPSLKDQALEAFDRIEYAPSEAEDFAIIRRAIESIPDDQ